jgi:MATE family multidrug resistance protein
VTVAKPSGEEIKANLRLAVPFAAAQFAQVALGAIATWMFGRGGALTLAGGTLGVLVQTTFLIFCAGLFNALSVLVAEATSRKVRGTVEPLLAAGMVIATLLFASAAIAVTWARQLFVVLGEPEGMAALATTYLRTSIAGLPAALAYLVLRNALAGLSRPLAVTVTAAGAAGMLFVLGLLLATGDGDPSGVVRRTAIAMNATHWMSAGVLAVVVLRHGDRRWRVTAGQTWVAARALLRTGLPIGAMFLAEAGFFTAVALSIGRFGDVALAGHQIATQVCYLTFMVPSGIGMATTVRVADALAWRDMRRCRRAGMAGLAIGTLSMVVSALVLLGGRHHIVRLFVDVSAPGSARAVDLAENLLLIGAAFQLFDGVQGVAGGALRGMKMTGRALVLGVVSYWAVGLVTGALLSNTPLGIYGYWLGLAAGLASAAALLTWAFLRSTASLIREGR